ncbi:hypothetical protein [Tenacibaculum sp. nBUS_03]|uniref:hypothetical protein n=1 Tax=Tenacibaculum sp. nBUS_03 TaxID=3395320 RepID=UPI003EB756F3
MKTLYSCSVKRTDIETFMEIDIDYLREDIKNWRNDFLGKLNKDKVIQFAEKFVTQKT